MSLTVEPINGPRCDVSAPLRTTPAMMNGRKITITWHGELKDDRLTFRRQLGGGPQMAPLSLQRTAS